MIIILFSKDGLKDTGSLHSNLNIIPIEVKRYVHQCVATLKALNLLVYGVALANMEMPIFNKNGNRHFEGFNLYVHYGMHGFVIFEKKRTDFYTEIST